jgi:Ca-activated chloride channel homolog
MNADRSATKSRVSVLVRLSALTTGVVGALLAAAFAQDAPMFRTDVDLVNMEVVVTDKKGDLVPNLTYLDFTILEDGQPQSVRYFSAGPTLNPDRGLHLGLLLDVSESMGPNIGFVRSSAIAFLKTVAEAVDITVVDFDTEVRTTRYEPKQFVRLVERIRQQKTGGATALYDAIGVYLANAAEQDGRKVMLLYTDGGDNQSAMGLSDLIEVLKTSDVTIYVIGQVTPQPNTSWGAVRRELTRIAEVTGGQAFFPQSSDDLRDTYAAVLAEVRTGYTLGYQSTNGRTDGAWRDVEVKVTPRDGRQYKVRSRKGYFAPYQPTSKPCGPAPSARAVTTVPNC